MKAFLLEDSYAICVNIDKLAMLLSQFQIFGISQVKP